MNLKPDLEDWVAALPRSAPSSSPLKLQTLKPKQKPKNKSKLYELLDTLFDGLAFAIRFLRLYGAKQTFSNIKRVIEHMTKTRFTYTHMSQFKFILPDVIWIDKNLIRDDSTNSFKHDLLVTFKPNPAIIPDPIGYDDIPYMYKSVNNDEISQISKLFQTRLKTFYESNSHEDVDVPSLVVDSFTNPDSTILKVSFSGSLDALTDTACSNSLISTQIYNN
ncbi:CDT1-like protein a, chloroplastic [Tanacetum coccineum]